MEQIRILGVAPYEGIQALMTKVAEEYENIEFTALVGNLIEGVEAAQKTFDHNYDIIISRGGTAQLLHDRIDIPVVEIGVSFYDILLAFKLAAQLPGPKAIVGFPSVTLNAKLLCEIQSEDIDVFTIEREEEVYALLEEMKRKGYQTVLCDKISDNMARRLGMNTILITSGAESIRAAFDMALLLCENRRKQQGETEFLRMVLSGQTEKAVVFDSEGHVRFSNTAGMSAEILSALRRELPEKDGEERRFFRHINEIVLDIRSKRMRYRDSDFTVCYLTDRKNMQLSDKNGIYYVGRHELEKTYYEDFFNIIGFTGTYKQEIDAVGQTGSPVLLVGEKGTGKEYLARSIFLNGKIGNQIFILIDCELLDNGAMAFLVNEPESPLAETDCTLFFKNVDVLKADVLKALIFKIRDTETDKRNRIIFSGGFQDSKIQVVADEIKYVFQAISFHVPPLRKNYDMLPQLINLYISQLNLQLAKQILGVDESGLELLQKYSWKYNYDEFKQIIYELAVLTDGTYISGTMVKKKLQESAGISDREEERQGELDLSRPLHEIEKDIVNRVLKETDGNQSAAARRLGISRTTLWRYLQEE